VTYSFPSGQLNFFGRKRISKNYSVFATPGFLPDKFRTGGFSILDLIFKLYLVIFGRYDVIHVTAGHRPSQLIPSVISKFLYKTVIVDEWWEWFGEGGIANQRSGIKGRLISSYDCNFELSTKKFYDLILPITNILKSRLKNNKETFSRCHVTHGGSETKGLGGLTISESRKKVNIDEDSFVVGMSNICAADMDDNDLFLKVFKSLPKRYPKIRFLMTGVKQDIEIISIKYDLKDYIINPGWVSFEDYNSFLCSCNIFALPLKDNPRNRGRWPNKIGDYLSVSRPIVANTVGDLHDLFRNYKIGVSVSHNFTDIEDNILSFLNGKYDSKYYGSDSKKLSKSLDFEKRVIKILSLYHSKS